MEAAHPQPNKSHPSGLTLRILSSLVLVPLALAAVWFGSPLLPALVALAGAGMGYEWARMSRVASPAAVCLIIAAPLIAACATAVGQGAAAVPVAAIFAAGAALAERRMPARLWAGVGTLWIALPCIALLWLDRGGPGRGQLDQGQLDHSWSGRAAILWLLAVVWASDIGAYAFGRLIGGPKLAPALSPNKTWAGALGGLVCAMLVGLAAARLEPASASAAVAVSLMVAIAAQIGDLAESFAKRCFGVKDSGNLIPGHGGLLDRLDSLLTAALMQALVLAALGANGFGP